MLACTMLVSHVVMCRRDHGRSSKKHAKRKSRPLGLMMRMLQDQKRRADVREKPTWSIRRLEIHEDQKNEALRRVLMMVVTDSDKSPAAAEARPVQHLRIGKLV